LKKIFEYEKNESIELQLLFYLYLLIKNKFAGIFIQRNHKYGFDNFSKYQDTKHEIIKGTLYEKLATKMAVKYNMRENYIDKLELRITPEKEEILLREKIKNCDKYSKKEEEDKKHIKEIHFLKNKKMDWGIPKGAESISICRELKLRKRIEKEAQAIHELRRNAGDATLRIYGIDAASHEVNCRPEVFGQTFRYLSESHICYPSYYHPSKLFFPHLKKTYHAGEDFYDIIDGLRAIDEAVLFLHLKYGDRIGHGVALGLDPEKYYNSRPHIAMPLQNALDNYAWILYCIGKFKKNIRISPSYYAQLNYLFNKHFNKLHSNSSISEQSLSPDLLTYIDAWKLRGDNPLCYRDEAKTENDMENITKRHLNLFLLTPWERYNFCNRNKYNHIKKNVYDLYHRYHFDNGLKDAASESVEIEINNEYIEIVKQIQNLMRNFILRKGVAIESNPSSNFLISRLDKIIELPIFKMFPVEESEDDSLRLNTSVNTDDQGVFFTSLVKEYTLLAGALQQEVNSNGFRRYSDDKILNWIKHLINNSKEQCFMQDVGNIANV
jgi:adenosine deaminase